jgi:GH25 family lysozyme M1 (1,4-beta-N-acetylmuramidase)/uncharacterized protein YraI
MKVQALLLVTLLIGGIVAELGIDISAPTSEGITETELKCFISQGYTFLIIQAWSGGVGINPSLGSAISKAKAAGFTYIDVYAYICPVCSGNNPPTNMAASLSAAIAGTGVNYVWLDVEACPPSNCWPNAASGVSFLQATVSAFQSHGVKVGFYSSEGSWDVTGDSTAFKSYPLWYAHFDNNPSFSEASSFATFGGWTSTPVMKQYVGDATVCGVDVDLDYWPKRPTGTTPSPPPPHPAGCTVIYATTADVNLRGSPSLSGTVLTVMPTGSTAYEIGTAVTAADGYNWIQVSYNGQLGYAAESLLSKSGSCTPTPAPSYYCVTATPNLRLRSSASTSASVLATMPTGVHVISESCCTSANGYSWRKVQYGNIVGYAADEFMKSCVPSGLFQNGLNLTLIPEDMGACTSDVGSSSSTLAVGFGLSVILAAFFAY